MKACTPPSSKGTLAAPGNFGSFNWGSMSVDADNGLLVAVPMMFAPARLNGHRIYLAVLKQRQ
jgi:glucose dehydrogenase